jgi:DNA-directed RNA polymerase specialized sigma24 family protein
MNDEEVLKNLSQGSKKREAGFRYLHAKYNNQIAGFLRRKCTLSPEELEDVLQESWFRFVQSVEKGQYLQKASVPTYLAKIAIHECFRIVGKRSPVTLPTGDLENSSDPNIPSSTIYLERQRQLCYQLCMANALEQFEKDFSVSNCLKALTLQVKGGSILEIAEEIDKSDSATKEFLSQCRKKLQSCLKHCEKMLEILNN